VLAYRQGAVIKPAIKKQKANAIASAKNGWACTNCCTMVTIGIMFYLFGFWVLAGIGFGLPAMPAS
jgi:hypothetical protein